MSVCHISIMKQAPMETRIITQLGNPHFEKKRGEIRFFYRFCVVLHGAMLSLAVVITCYYLLCKVMCCHMLSFASETLTDLDGLRRHLAAFQSTMTRCLRDVTLEFVRLVTLRLMAYRARRWGTAQVAPAMLVNPCQGLRCPHTQTNILFMYPVLPLCSNVSPSCCSQNNNV